jgi:hypothetical protein
MAATHARALLSRAGGAYGDDRHAAMMASVPRLFGSNGSKFLTVHNRYRQHQLTARSEVNSMTDEEWDEIFEQTFRKFVADGLIYDTGERGWCEQTKSYKILWAFVPPKSERH